MKLLSRETGRVLHSPAVGAVVVTHNRLSLLKECIAALRSQSRVCDLIIVIDNGSRDGTPEWLATAHDVVAIRQPNLGCAGGFHRGVKEALDRGVDYIWLMDDDVVPRNDALDELLNGAGVLTALSEPFGFLVSRAVTSEGMPTNVPPVDNRGRKGAYPDWIRHAADGLIKVQSATFVSLFIPAQTVAAVGLPSAEFFIWGDDDEFTGRIARYRSSYVAVRSLVSHRRASSTIPNVETEADEFRLRNFFYWYRNVSWLLRRDHGTYAFIRYSATEMARATRCLRTSNGLMRASVILKGLFAGMFFKPTIEEYAQSE